MLRDDARARDSHKLYDTSHHLAEAQINIFETQCQNEMKS